MLTPPAPHLDRFATPTSFRLIGPTLRRLFKRLGTDICSRGVRPLRTLSDGLAASCRVPLECVDIGDRHLRGPSPRGS
jgi:hypothetical protein